MNIMDMDVTDIGASGAASGAISIGEQPYTYARVCAMKGKLISPEQYSRLLKMRINEILKFLQETTYKREIDEMAVTHLGLNSAEAVLDKNLIRTLRKLKRISGGPLATVISKYLERYDLHNLKAVLRGKFTGSSEQKIEQMLLTVGALRKPFLLNLLKKNSIPEIVEGIEHALVQQAAADGQGAQPLQSLRAVRTGLSAACDAFKRQGNLFEIENVLDRYYYASLLGFARRIAGQGALFRNFLLHEIDVLNLRILLRLKREKVAAGEIEKYLFFSGATLSSETLRLFARIDTLDELVEEIRRRGFCKKFEKIGDKKEREVGEKEKGEKGPERSLIDIEAHLQHYLLEKANLMIHQHMLSINVILGFMLAKEIEVRNLKILVKGKHLGLPEDFLARELVTR